jgi:hypothetical protein
MGNLMTNNRRQARFILRYREKAGIDSHFPARKTPSVCRFGLIDESNLPIELFGGIGEQTYRSLCDSLSQTGNHQRFMTVCDQLNITKNLLVSLISELDLLLRRHHVELHPTGAWYSGASAQNQNERQRHACSHQTVH